jgi:hypothetical protein
MKNEKAEKTDTEIIAGNCSKCNGPVIRKMFIKDVPISEYHECLNCRAKCFPSFGKIIQMADDNPKTLDIMWEKNKNKEDLIKSWEKYDKMLPPNSYEPLPNTYPSWPDIYRYPTSPYPYTYPTITCRSGSISTKDYPPSYIIATI